MWSAATAWCRFNPSRTSRGCISIRRPTRWIRRRIGICKFTYPVEEERGLDFEEDLFTPFELTYRLAEGQTAYIVATIGEEERGQRRGPGGAGAGAAQGVRARDAIRRGRRC